MLATPGAAAALAPSPGTTDADPASEVLPPEAETAREDARAFADDLEAADPSEAVLRLSEEAGKPVPQPEAPDLGAVEAIQRLAAAQGTEFTPFEVGLFQGRLHRLPAELEAPLAEVLSGLVAAYELRQDAFADLTREELDLLRTHRPLLDRDGGTGMAVTASGSGLDDPVTVGPERSEVDRERVRALAAEVDRAKLVQAESVLLAAVDDALPALRDAAAEIEAPHPRHAPPTLTYGSLLALDVGGPTHYHSSYWVTLDLVGDDTYENNAGGTLVDTASTSFSAPVALALDVTGDDEYRYLASSGTNEGGSVLAVQGGGFLGVGALVGAAGAAAYDADLTVNPSSGEPPDASFDVDVVAQGAGHLGAGALVDTLGPNTYEARASTDGGQARTFAQGGGFLGLGLHVGNPQATTYRASATSNPHTVVQTSDYTSDVVGLGEATAQGFGLGALVDGAGDDTYTSTSSGGTASTGAQGAGFPAAALVDGAGQDAFKATAIVDPALDLVLDQDCPSNFKCFPSLDVTVEGGDAEVAGQGHSFLGTGVLLDGGVETATTTAVATNAPSASGHVTCSGGGTCQGSADVEVAGQDADAYAQGSGGAGLGSAGVLLGSAGAGTYVAEATSDARAEAVVDTDEVGSCDASAFAGDARVRSQGSGDLSIGVLVEPGGPDGYDAIQSTTASAVECGSAGASSVGGLDWVGHGAADGIGAGVLADAGGDDTYAADEGTAATEDTCWSNSPPGVPDLAVGVGVDASASGPPTGCLPVPPN